MAHAGEIAGEFLIHYAVRNNMVLARVLDHECVRSVIRAAIYEVMQNTFHGR